MSGDSSSRRYRQFFRGDPRRDVDEELAFHLAMRVDEFRRGGMSDAEAEEAAMQRFGDVKEIRSEVKELAVKRDSRHRRAWGFDAIRQDARLALRSLVANPGYAIAVTLTLALGIGANAAVFSVAYGVLIRPFPYRDAEQLVRIWSRNDRANLPLFSVSADDYRDWRDQNRTMSRMGAFTRARDAALSTSETPIAVAMTNVTPSVFALVGTPAARGRVITADDARPDAPGAVVITDALWTTSFGADSNILGRRVVIDGRPSTIVGVMPVGWTLPETNSDVFAPLQLDGLPAQRGNHYLRVLGRMKPGVTIQSALADLNTISERVDRLVPAATGGWSANVTSVVGRAIGTEFRRAVIVLMGVVTFVLLIACANAANLQLARAASRERELAIRAALGASRRRIALQLLTESLVVAGCAGLLGLMLAYGGVSVLRALGETTVPRLQEVRLDAPVLAFTAIVALGSGLLFGLVPAWRSSRSDLNDVLKAGRGLGASAVSSRARGALVITEISLSLVLLIGAGLLLRSFARLRSVDIGFNEQNIVVLPMQLPASAYPSPQSVSDYYHAALDRAQRVGGVESAALVNSAPFAGPNRGLAFTRTDQMLAPGAQMPTTDARDVTPGYFHTMGIRVRAGRDFSTSDRAGMPLVGLASVALVKRYFSDSDPIGKQIRLDGAGVDPVVTIVGVVDDVRYQSIDADDVRPMLYVSADQDMPRTMMLVARGGPAVASTLRSTIGEIDRRLPPPAFSRMSDLVGQVLATQRFALVLFGVFAGTAVLLAVIGLYGVLSYLVRQRAHELAIRTALGAPARSIVQLIVGGALKLTAVGVAIGLVVSYELTRSLGSLLFGVSPTDAATFLELSLALALVAVAASIIPAWRATRADPIGALRGEA